MTAGRTTTRSRTREPAPLAGFVASACPIGPEPPSTPRLRKLELAPHYRPSKFRSCPLPSRITGRSAVMDCSGIPTHRSVN